MCLAALKRYADMVDVFCGNYMEHYYEKMREYGIRKPIIGTEVQMFYRKDEQALNNVQFTRENPSDYIYYQGLAWHALGNDERAKKSFHQLVIFGEQHIFDKVGYDFFAVSMPELEVYQDDIQKRSDDYCKRMMALGRKGLSAIS